MSGIGDTRMKYQRFGKKTLVKLCAICICKEQHTEKWYDISSTSLVFNPLVINLSFIVCMLIDESAYAEKLGYIAPAGNTFCKSLICGKTLN